MRVACRFRQLGCIPPETIVVTHSQAPNLYVFVPPTLLRPSLLPVCNLGIHTGRINKVNVILRLVKAPVVESHSPKQAIHLRPWKVGVSRWSGVL